MAHEENYRYGYESWTHTKVVPLQGPIRYRWLVGPVSEKTTQPPRGTPGQPATGQEEITMQLTADQQVELSITGEDAYNNPVDVSGDTEWHSSDESIVTVEGNGNSAVATAVGPVGTAAVTVSNDVNQDGTGDFQGSIAIDVVAGRVAEIVVQQGQVTDKQGNPVVPEEPTQPVEPEEPPVVDNGSPDFPEDEPHPDQTLPGDLPTDEPYVDPRRSRR